MTFIYSSPVFYIYLGLKLLAAFLILFVRLFISNWLHDDNMIDDNCHVDDDSIFFSD